MLYIIGNILFLDVFGANARHRYCPIDRWPSEAPDYPWRKLQVVNLWEGGSRLRGLGVSMQFLRLGVLAELSNSLLVI